jgi:hypothetical protein
LQYISQGKVVGAALFCHVEAGAASIMMRLHNTAVEYVWLVRKKNMYEYNLVNKYNDKYRWLIYGHAEKYRPKLNSPGPVFRLKALVPRIEHQRKKKHGFQIWLILSPFHGISLLKAYPLMLYSTSSHREKL